MWTPWIIATAVAAAGGFAIGRFSRHWLIGGIAIGLGTALALPIGDEILSGKPNKFILLVIVLASFLTVPAALIASYSTFRLRRSGDQGGDNEKQRARTGEPEP